MALRPHGIIRIAYVRLGLLATDIVQARSFYRDVMGLIEDPRSNAERLLLRCWHEAYPYSLVIERSVERGLLELGFEMADFGSLAAAARRLKATGASESEPGAPLPGLGASVLCEVPGGLKIRLFAAVTDMPSYLGGHMGPDWVVPRELRATVAPLSLNHVGVTVPDPARTVDFLRSELGFAISERIESDDGRRLLSALMFRMSKDVGGQEIAIFRGDEARLHHIAFTKEDPNDILVDGQYLGEAKVRIDALGPTRQSYGRTFSLYFYDPLGIRLELCSGGRITEVHPEFEPVVWTESALSKALSFHDRQVSNTFLDACL